MMGMSLTYSLMKPHEVYNIKKVHQDKRDKAQMPAIPAPTSNHNPTLAIAPLPTTIPQPETLNNQIVPPPMPIQRNVVPVINTIPMQIQQNIAQPQLQLHALDPINNNVLPLEGALIPSVQQDTPNDNEMPNFDLMEILAEFQNNNDNDDLILAATQSESQLQVNMGKATNMSKTIMARREAPTFTGCTFGSIGTIFMFKSPKYEQITLTV